ncbi:protein of unknown function [Shewanella benthica]|uniref:Uncharacterized protein n=1 Tax=Shewanella benthica TaxID=43661 RepID=A0A330LZV0_9GAMM|nr:protein of unknown function [Shewanella benthica]SQH74496.1 protein of unknown function [Shewanella benthica]SQH74622.1 protein of unknown function [Shewanella benthica]SQH74633.1 protein of unknown function [Shewanella benthica]SQH74816.1 protein of unknown function [Shewanella benthica]
MQIRLSVHTDNLFLLEQETHLYGVVCSLKIWKADSVNVKGTIVKDIS